MRKLTQLSHYKQDYYYCLYFLAVILILLIINLFVEYFIGEEIRLVTLLFCSLIYLMFFKIYHRALKELLYSFWGFSIPIQLYLIYCLGNSLTYNSTNIPSYLYLVTLVLHWLILYIMSGPIFYPRVRWWEFDFRYRGDLKILVKFHDRVIESRLTDLRRRAGCIVCFNELELGEIAEIECQEFGELIKLEAAIISESSTTPGRGQSYGIKFLLDDKVSKKNFRHLRRQWFEHTIKKLSERIRLSNEFK